MPFTRRLAFTIRIVQRVSPATIRSIFQTGYSRKTAARRSLRACGEAKLKLLIVGGGGREHALAWKLAQSPLAQQIFVAPGNAGTEWPQASGRASSANVAIAADDVAALLAFARQKAIDLTVV